MDSKPGNSDVSRESPKYFFQDKFSKLGVRGNFMPLAAQPVNVDLADWLAHQTVENYRLVSVMVSCVQEIDSTTGRPLCNPINCPRMTAGRHTYTWLDNNRNPVPVSAAQYISLVQRWMDSKITDARAFPTEALRKSLAGPSSDTAFTKSVDNGPLNLVQESSTDGTMPPANRSWIGKEAGFPESFLSDCKTCFRQIFRIYAHLYHSHWVDPYWHLTNGSNAMGWTDLNSCFVHFITIAKLYGLLSDKDSEPMQPLLDLWVSNGSLPMDAVNGTQSIVNVQ